MTNVMSEVNQKGEIDVLRVNSKFCRATTFCVTFVDKRYSQNVTEIYVV